MMHLPSIKSALVLLLAHSAIGSETVERRATPKDPPAGILQSTLNRGQRLITSMEHVQPYTSQFSKWNELQKHGWRDVSKGFSFGKHDSAAMKHILGSARGIGIKLVHDQEVSGKAKVGSSKESGKVEKTSTPTNAEYINVFYPDKGIIVADNNHGPANRVAESKTSKGADWNDAEDSLPALRQLSDIWWLSWTHVTSKFSSSVLKHLNKPTKTPPIKGVVRREIQNQDTKDLLHYILRHQFPNEQYTKDGEAPTWEKRVTLRPPDPKPKDEHGKEIDTFALMVGSTNGLSVAYLCSQHSAKDQLGHREIKSITIWQDSPDDPIYAPNLWLEIGPVASGHSGRS